MDARAFGPLSLTPTPPDGPRKPVILVVEDEPDIRRAYIRLFCMKGCTAMGASSIAEAITMISRPWMHIDVCLCDLMLPDGPGETVLAIVKNTARLGHVRMVAHSATYDAARIAGLGAYGAHAFVAKPCEFRDLYEACFPGGR